MAFWLVKSESNKYGIDDLKRDGYTFWGGVRNYQARNFLRSMRKGELVLYYHSVVEPVGIVGIARVKKEAYPDPTQFDKKSEYFEPAASKEEPRWFCPDLEFVEKFSEIIPLREIRGMKNLEGMVLLQKMSRLSVQPVSDKHFNILVARMRDQRAR